MPAVRKLAVIGAGQMGGGIAQTAAAVAKIPVILFDTREAQLYRSRSSIEALLLKQVNKGKMSTADSEATLGLISTSSRLEDLADVDFVIEAVSEDYELKAGLFKSLSQILCRPKEAIIASNTSSISITKLAAAYVRPENVVGMHFMNPVPVMRLVELIAGRQTSVGTMEQTKGLAELMGKTTTVSADTPGFIANRLLMPYINEAIFALAEGVGTKEDIDKTMVLGTNVPMGPLKLADFIGLDTCLAIQRVLHADLGDSKYRPCPLLVQYVNAGWLGKKSGRGFYTWDQQ